jgi:hypothetical protein
MDWRVPYIIGNLLKHRCLNPYMTHLDTSNTSYDQKKGRESNWQFDFQPLKVWNRPYFLTFTWRATYHWKDIYEGYNVFLDLISIRGLHAKLWTPKVARIPIVEFRDSHLGVPRQNDIWVLVPWPNIEYTIRGKVVASPKFGSWWVLWIRVCPWFILAPKVLQLCTNQLVVSFCAGPCD